MGGKQNKTTSDNLYKIMEIVLKKNGKPMRSLHIPEKAKASWPGVSNLKLNQIQL